MPTSNSYHIDLIESLQDPEEAAAYLEAVLEDGDVQYLYLALKNVLQAQIKASDGSQLLKWQKVTQTLSQPHLDLPILLDVMEALGFKVSVACKNTVA